MLVISMAQQFFFNIHLYMYYDQPAISIIFWLYLHQEKSLAQDIDKKIAYFCSTASKNGAGEFLDIWNYKNKVSSDI